MLRGGSAAHFNVGGGDRKVKDSRWIRFSLFAPPLQRRFQTRQRRTARVRQFFWSKNAHNAILTVISALAVHLPSAHAGHGFAQRLPMGADVRLWQTAEYIKLRAEFVQQTAIFFLHLAGGRAYAKNFAHNFRQRNQRAHFRFALKHGRRVAVSQFKNAVQYANGKRLAADGADVAERQRFLWLQHHVAGSVPVEVVFAFIRVKFHGAQKTARERALILTSGCGAQGGKHARITGFAFKQVGLAPQIRARVGV